MHLIILFLSHIFFYSFPLILSLALFHVFTFFISVSISAYIQTYITYNLLLRDGMVACSHSDSSFCSNDDFGSPRATSSIVVWNQIILLELRFLNIYIYIFMFFALHWMSISKPIVERATEHNLRELQNNVLRFLASN